MHFGHGAPPSNGNIIYVTQYGATGNGVTDDQSAIDKAIATAQSSGATVYFGPGNFLHSSPIIANGVKLLGSGPGTVLTASNGANGAVILQGNGPSLSGFTISSAHMVQQNGGWPVDRMPQGSAVWVNSASNFTLSYVTISGAGGNAIDVANSGPGIISYNQISNASVTAFAIWDCNTLQVTNNNVQNAGAAPINVGPLSTGSNNLYIASNLFQAGPNSGTQPGMYLAGLQTSSFCYNNCIGCYLQLANSGLNQPAISGVQIAGNAFTSPTTYGILVGYSPGSGASVTSTSNISIMNNSITNVQRIGLTPACGIALQTAQNVTAASNMINGSHDLGISVVACQNIVIQQNNIANIGSVSLMAEDQGPVHNTGSLKILNNQFSNICINSGVVIDVFNEVVYQTPPFQYTELDIVGNSLSGPANNATDYIVCQVPSAGIIRNISGNTQANTALPDNIVP
jgi:hypothetical protein